MSYRNGLRVITRVQERSLEKRVQARRNLEPRKKGPSQEKNLPTLTIPEPRKKGPNSDHS